MQFPERALTAKEREIITLLILGCRDLEIAGQLSISRETVKTHVKNILTKLRARTRAAAAVEYTLKNQREVIDSMVRNRSADFSQATV